MTEVEQLDVDAVRAQFPIFSTVPPPSTDPLKELPQIFFDNAGGTQILRNVSESIKSYLEITNVQLGAGYQVSQVSTELYTNGLKAGAEYINASPDEIVIGPSTTQLFRNLAVSMIPYLSKYPNAELVVSMLDHEANIASWVFLAETLKLKLVWWTGEALPSSTAGAVSRNLHLTPASLKPLLNKNTFMVSCTHTSNVLGSITPIKALSELIKATAPQALLCVDAVAYAPHRAVDVKDLGADFYCFSWYKIYGPHCAQLYASRAVQDRVLTSLGHFFKAGFTLEDKLGLAGASYELVQAIPHVTAYLSQISWPAVAAHEERLQEVLLSYLRSKPDVYEICGEERADAALRVPVISFFVKGRKSQDVVKSIESSSPYGLRFGHAYTKRLLDGMWGTGEDGIVRASLVHYNTVDEIKGFVEVLDRIVPAL